MRKQLVLLLALLSTLLWVFACIPAARAEPVSEGKPLSEQELRTRIENGVLLDTISWDNTTRGSMALLRNGPVFVLWKHAGGTGGADRGMWRIQGNKLCITWKEITAGEEVCLQYFPRSDGRIAGRLASSGELRHVATPREQ